MALVNASLIHLTPHRLYDTTRLRICARLRYLWRGMPLYRQLRVKWSVFHRLLSLTDTRLRYGTPGLPARLKRRRELMLGYSQLLRERGFVPGRYAPEVLVPATVDVQALMQRWKQHTQGRASARFLGEVCIYRGSKQAGCRQYIGRLGTGLPAE